MRRILTTPLLALVVASLVAPQHLPGQAKGEPEIQATVIVADPGTRKESNLDGTIVEENVGGLKMKIGKEEKTVPALDIVWITYKTKVNALEFRKGYTLEKKAQEPGVKLDKRMEYLGDAVREYRKLLEEIKAVPQAHRLITYKMAEIQGIMAKYDNTKLDAAIKALDGFRQDYGRSWQLIPTLTLLAELQESNGNLDGASKMYEEIASLPEAPAELKNSAQLMEANMLLRAKKYTDAEKRLISARTRLPVNDPQRGKITVMICQAKMNQNKLDGVDKELNSALTGTADPLIRAIGHNCLGDYYLAKKQPEDAFWQYFKVHMMYSQDRNEHARALYHLSKLFDEVQKDPIRAQEMQEKLLTEKDYTGTEWQAKAKAGEKKAPTPNP